MANAEPDPGTPLPSLPSELPVVPLRNAVVLPLTAAPLSVSRLMSVEAVNRSLSGEEVLADFTSPPPDAGATAAAAKPGA